jgi:pimeloyl-ACP methyl ester carboxylesterase
LFALPQAVAQTLLKTEVVTVDVRPGVTISYLGVTGGGQPKAAVILLAGGNGALNLAPSGAIGSGLAANFLIRTRGQFARQGFYVAALDAASDRQAGMDGATRLSPQYAQDIAKVIAEVKKRTGLPVWLVGTSAGTLSAASAAARIAQAELRPNGIVLTSTMTTLSAADNCGKSVYDTALAAIKVPVLVVSHREDNCACTPGGAAAGAKLLAALAGTSSREHKVVTGGSPPLSGPCDARAPHGFFGIEESVVLAIADWIKSH